MFHVTFSMLSCLITAKHDFYCYVFLIIFVAYCLFGESYYAVLLCEWVSEWVNEWMNEWVRACVSEWVNEWVNEWMNGWNSNNLFLDIPQLTLTDIALIIYLISRCRNFADIKLARIRNLREKRNLALFRISDLFYERSNSGRSTSFLRKVLFIIAFKQEENELVKTRAKFKSTCVLIG